MPIPAALSGLALGRVFGRGQTPRRALAPPSDETATGRKNLILLIQLRWIAVAGQLATIATVSVLLRAELPLAAMASVMAALVVLNLASLLRLGRPATVSNIELFAVLLFDVAALTAQLYLAGGATNPFAFLYLLQVMLAAVLLESWTTCLLLISALACFGALTDLYRPLALPGLDAAGLFRLYVVGSFVCFGLVAGLLVVFVTRINRNLRERDAWLASLRQRAVEEDHIVRMGLLASGAAHELGTPLSTVSVILGDWRRMPALTQDPELAGEIDAMQAEIRRCKAIVTNILLSAGEARSEKAGVTTLGTFLRAAVAEWRRVRPAADLAFVDEIGADRPIVADSALKQSLFNLLDNAADACPDGRVTLAAAVHGSALSVTVSDEGPGFPPAMLAQIGKPYRSSKGRRGGGLGLFLVVNVVRKLGGTFEARNRPQGGAAVTLVLPLAALEIA